MIAYAFNNAGSIVASLLPALSTSSSASSNLKLTNTLASSIGFAIVVVAVLSDASKDVFCSIVLNSEVSISMF